MRIILDANVIISALIKVDGIPATVVKEIITNRAYTLLLSEEIIDELKRTLNYPKVRKHISFSDHQLGFFVTYLEMIAYEVAPRFKYDPLVLNDPKDDAYIIAAIEGNADFIISGDKHLLTLNPYRGISIIKPADFFKRIVSLAEGTFFSLHEPVAFLQIS